MNEDYNDEFVVHEIITYDYNNHLQDNVTCSMTVTPSESTDSFILKHDGNYDYNCKGVYCLLRLKLYTKRHNSEVLLYLMVPPISTDTLVAHPVPII